MRTCVSIPCPAKASAGWSRVNAAQRIIAPLTTRPFNIGIVGFGRIGAEHAAWIGAGGSFHVAAVFDPTAARRAIAAARGLTTVDSLDALLDDSSVDALLIATPTSMHLDHASRAIAAGKHVMVEKPVALDAAGATALAEQARRARVMLSVFHCRRWDLDYLTVAQAIRDKSFGRVFNVESRLGQCASCVGPAAPEFRPGWRNEASFGGGGLYDWGSHFVDQLWQLMLPAKPLRVFAQLRGNVWSRDCDDFARVVVDFDDGSVGLCEINTTTTRPLPRWLIDGERGSASSPHSPSFDTHEWARLTMTNASDGATHELASAARGLSETQIWEQFARACNGDGEPAVTIESVIPTMKLLDAARQSSAEGRAVRL